VGVTFSSLNMRVNNNFLTLYSDMGTQTLYFGSMFDHLTPSYVGKCCWAFKI